MTPPLTRQPRPARGTSPSGRSSLGLIVTGSLVTGLVLALLLVLVVFAGAREHVITGAAMLAFALGWAMLAVLSMRRTDQPQRWAFVPAACMAIVGAALLLFAPGNGALTAASWVWPPLTLALAAWMGVQLRRTVAGRVRWLLYPVVAFLAVGAVGGMYESAALARDQRTYAMPGTLYDVGGYRLHLNCSPDQFTVLPDYAGFYSTWRRVSVLLPSLGRLGAGQLLDSSAGSTLPGPAASQAQAFATSPRDMRSQRDEFSAYHDMFRQAQALTTLGGKPLVVVTATDGQQTGWAIAQDRLASLSSNTSHRFAHATHAALLDGERGSETSVRAINDVVTAVRTDSPLVTQ